MSGLTLGAVRTLCIDTSAGSAVAVHDSDGGVLARARVGDPRGHAERLTPLISEALDQAGVGIDEIYRVAVGTGPAPFTGLRVGLVTARAVARARGIPVYGVCSLDLLARQVLDEHPHATVLVATDARRREVYTARYRSLGEHDVSRLDGPHVGPAAEVATGQSAGSGVPEVVAGAGAVLYDDVLPPSPGVAEQVDPAVLARVVAVRLARADQEVELDTEPRYLRRPDVSVAAARKRAT